MKNGDIEDNGETDALDLFGNIYNASDGFAERQEQNNATKDNLLTCNSELVNRFHKFRNPLKDVSKFNSYFHQALFQNNVDVTPETIQSSSQPDSDLMNKSNSECDKFSVDERCYNSAVLEPNSHITDRSDSVQYCMYMTNNKDINLNHALDNMSLAFNPITKQLLFVSPKNVKKIDTNLHSPTDSDNSRKCDDFSDEGNYSFSNGDKADSVSSNSPGSTLLWRGHQRDKDGGSFSSNISSWSDYSLPGSNTSRDEEVNNENAYAETCVNNVAPEFNEKQKKKLFTDFFSRNVFNRKNGDGESESKLKPLSVDKSQNWKIFGSKLSGQEMKLTPPSTGNISNCDTHLTHRRQGSSTSEKNFEDIIASSTALIQHDRPAGLPAKDAAEADRHAVEVARLVAAARKRAAEATARGAAQAAARRKKEAQRDAALSTWRTAVLDWDSIKSTRQIQDLWWNGIPPPVRGKVWQLALSNNLNITPKLYALCVKEAKHRLEEARIRRITMKVNFHEQMIPSGDTSNSAKDDISAIDKCLEQQDSLNKTFEIISERDKYLLHRNYSDQNFKSHCGEIVVPLNNSKSNPDLCDFGSESGMELIQLDISRTFPNLCIFQPGGPYFDVLHEVLAAYACYRPDIGYVQGMSFIAAILILNMDAPDAFTCFANLLNGPILRPAFARDELAVQRIWSAYTTLLVDQLPSLAGLSTELVPELYLLEWLYTAFAKAMPLDAACRVWDVFIRDGDEFLLRTALGILYMYQDDIINMDFITASQFLTKLPEDMCIDTLFKSISSVNMSIGKKSFQELIASCESEAEQTEADTVVRL